MSLKLVIEGPEKIKLFDPDLQNNFKIYVLRPLAILLIFSPLLYFFGIFHPSYQLYCEKKIASFATGCRLKSTYYFIIPWYTHLGEVKYANFQINPSFRQNKVRNSCGEIVLLTSPITNPLSYEGKKFSFYLSCGNFAELREIANGINNYLREEDVKEFNIPSLPRTLEQYLWTIGLVCALLYQSKRIEVIFDKNLGLVIVKTTWVISWTKTYPLSAVKKVEFYQTKDERRHLIMKSVFNTVDLGDVSDLNILEQKNLCRSMNDFLGQPQTNITG